MKIKSFVGVTFLRGKVTHRCKRGTGHQTGKTSLLTSFYNDNLYVGGAPFFSTPGSVILGTSLWPPLNTNPPLGNPKVMTLALPAGAMNSYLMSGSAPPAYLDMVLQDDTAVDYVTLSVWYF